MNIFKNLFKRKKKDVTVVKDMSLEDLLNARNRLIEAGKENSEFIKNSDKTPELENLIVDRVIHMENIQKDITTVKREIGRANVNANNDENIYEYDSLKTMRAVLNGAFKSNDRAIKKLLQKLQFSRRIRTINARMKQLSKKMEEINKGYTVQVNLVSGVI